MKQIYKSGRNRAFQQEIDESWSHIGLRRPPNVFGREDLPHVPKVGPAQAVVCQLTGREMTTLLCRAWATTHLQNQ
jgi:hypothetical protein